MALMEREIQGNGLSFIACCFSPLSPSIRLTGYLDPFLVFSLVPTWKEFSPFLSTAIQIPNKSLSDFGIDRACYQEVAGLPRSW